MAIVAVLTLFFAYGCFGALTKARDSACVSWFWGLLILSGWIASFATILAIVLALGVFATGLIALIGYYRYWEPSL